MPVVSEAQRRYAYAHQNEKWAREMLEASANMRGLPERVGERRRKHRGKRRGGRRKEDRD